MLKLLVLAAVLSAVHGYNILCVFPIPSRSHNHLAKGVVDSLLNAGHQVTWVTPYPFKNSPSNLKLISVDTQSIMDDVQMSHRNIQDMRVVKEFARNISMMTFQTPQLREVLVKTQFDAVITEWFFSDVEAGFAAIQRVPWIMLSGVVFNTMMEEYVDDVRSISTVPLMTNYYPMPMNLWQRISNSYSYLMMVFDKWMDEKLMITDYDTEFSPLAAARGVPLPSLHEAKNNLSILLVNSHPSFATSQPMPQNVIQIAGYHISEDVPPLPKDLQDLLDASPKGVVYFSMGSVFKSSAMPEHTQKDLIKILGELPYTVLWKFEKELPNLPKNIHIRSWMPQASILKHPNIKLFITHGGLLSTLEALQYGIPLLAVPVFGDQPSNANRAVLSGYARKVAFSPDMGGEFREALRELLSNDSYYKRAKYLSMLFTSREVKPAKLVSHYVELAIKSKGAFHLRSPIFLYAWYERWMLDQALILFTLLYILYRLLKKMLSMCTSKQKGKKEKKN